MDGNTFRLLPQYLQGAPTFLIEMQGNPNDHFISIWDNHSIVLEHPWDIRALKGYAALVFIQRKLKFWLLKKRVLVLHSLAPAASGVLRSIFSFLSPSSVYPHPTLLITKKAGLLHIICQSRALPCWPRGENIPIHLSHHIDTFIILNCFTLTYNNFISTLAIPRPPFDLFSDQDLANRTTRLDFFNTPPPAL